MVGPSSDFPCGAAGNATDTSNAASARTAAMRGLSCSLAEFGIMGTRTVERIRPSLALFVWICITAIRIRVPRRLGRAAGRSPCGGIRLAVQFLGRLCGDLGDVQRDLLLLTTAFDGHGHMVRCLNRIEDILATLWIIKRGAVNCRDQIAR